MEFKIIIKKLNHTLTQKEALVFDKWYKSSIKHKEYFDRVKTNFNNSIDFVDVEKGWNELKNKLEDNPSINRSLVWKFAAAAAVLVLISLPFIFEKSNANRNPTAEKAIMAGTDKAILTLENGSQIVLEKGKNYASKHITSNGKNLVYISNNKKSNLVQYNYLTIPKGGEFFVKLSDGTKVWLNSESKLKYPINFIKGETRTVELLYGEAYFDVSESTNHNGDSFKVKYQAQHIEVLGTEFNLKAYRDSHSYYTTLVEGEVAVSNDITRKILSPGEQSIVSDGIEGIKVMNVDLSHEVAWKNGFFSFNKESLGEMLKNACTMVCC